MEQGLPPASLLWFARCGRPAGAQSTYDIMKNNCFKNGVIARLGPKSGLRDFGTSKWSKSEISARSELSFNPLHLAPHYSPSSVT